VGEDSQAERAAQAVTQIVPEQVRCPECGHERVVYTLHSINTFADEEPTFVYRGYARCPWCGHKSEKDGAIEWLSADPEERRLQLTPGFEPQPEREQPPSGTTEVTFGKLLGRKPPGTR
jgi:DNA-directed RNA polymerase subunit RPC12/RpoP